MEASTSPAVEQLQSAAKTRMEQVEQEIEGAERDRKALDQRLARLTSEKAALAALLSAYGSDGARQPTPLFPTSGKSSADEVYDLLLEVGRPLHYTEIERILRAKGVPTGSGLNPANAFLATYYNDSRFYRPKRGVYAIKPADREVHSVGTKRRHG